MNEELKKDIKRDKQYGLSSDWLYNCQTIFPANIKYVKFLIYKLKLNNKWVNGI